ncbi:hypothetical protein PENSUB_1928 [Penicillium subrubescens]|uniref:Uncharacterized protein n=1 Tax=Penicillium subrubescens TaxID=1316194 RepID=A0A1Q5UJ02_9EURO|nr:hypothetical protein PENSUB_1928 [Penicillium subrubescens]
MSANHEALNGPCPNMYSELNDFITRRHDKVLRPLHFADISLSQFSAELECYLSVLDSGGSIAFCRGEKLASIQLSQRLETLFQTPTPRVLDGPQLTWTTVILAIGPRFDGPPTLRVGESLVEFAEDDLELLRSGAPWRFLNPWPDKGDCTKELQSGEMTLQEINESRQILHQVLDKMSVLEQGLMHHREVVAQLFQNQHPATSQEETPKLVEARDGPLAEYPDSVGASEEKALEPLDPSNDRTLRSKTTELRYNGSVDSSTADISTQHASPQAMNAASQGSRLHQSDFIQDLSE